MAQNKTELLAQLDNVHNNWFLGMAGVALLVHPGAGKLLNESRSVAGSMELDFSQVTPLVADRSERDRALKELVLGHYRALISETYEVIKAYARSAGKFERFTDERLFEFVRQVRNVVAHHTPFKFNARERAALPVHWRGRTITEAMDGQHLPIEFLGYDGMFQLHADMRAWADAELE